MKKFLTIFAVAALALTAAVSCTDKEDEETIIELKGISVSSPSLDLFVGDEATLTVKYTPENATNQPKATWTSSAETVAVVTEGKVTAVGAGEATITATVEKFTASCTVKVTAKDDYTGPVQGNSAWSVVGTLLDSNWGDVDYVCAEEDGIFVLKNVRLAADDQFKFRENKDWANNRGGAFAELGTGFDVTNGGDNIVVGVAGIYDLYYNPEVEQAAVVAKDGTPSWKELPPPPEGKIKIDGDFSDWANVQGLSNGSHGMFKFDFDEYYAYFYTWRTTEGRYSALWGDGVGYVYFALDLDNDPTTGESLNDNGPYEFIGYIYCFGGSAEAPEIKITAAGGAAPSPYTVENVEVAGKVDENGAYLEYRIPLTDIPALTEKFTVTSWGNKDLDKVTVSYPFEFPEPEVEWDYTPSAEYTADNNLWKAVDADHIIEWYYNPVWSDPVEGPSVKFTQSTYEFWNKIACTGNENNPDWTAQMWIHPNNELLLDATRKYSFSCKVYATSETPVFMKLYHKGEDGSRSFEIARTRIPAGQITELKVEDFTPIITPQCLLIDFGGVPANTKVFIKDIVLTEGDAVTPPQPMDWDYTPSAAFTADNNLWKVADGNEMYYYYHCTSGEWNGQDTIASEVPFMTKTQSTYELTYEEATANPWQNQFFIFPGDGHFVALNADKTYKISYTLAANADMYAFANFKTYDASTPKREGVTIHEWGAMNLKAKESVVIEHEFTGVAADNITLLFDFGGNPAGAKVFIKDIVITEVGGEVPPTPGAITIDGSFDDWANIAGVGEGTHGMVKVAVDENNLYFYSLRTKEGRYSEIWGSKAGYIYLGLNLDGDDATGESLWGNGPYEFIGVFYPYGATEGTFVAAPGDACMPETATLANAKAAGAVTDAGAIVEIAIPLADLPALPAEFDVTTWGNKDLSKVKMHYPYVPLPATVAEIIEKIPAEATGSSSAVEFEANLTSPAVVTYVNGKNAYIEDATGAILLYLTDHGLVAGDTIKGKVAIKAYWYNGIPETVVAFGEAAEIAHGDAPAPKEMTIAQLLANYDANLLRYIVIKDVKVTDGIADGDRNGAIAQADGNTIAVYAQINNGGLVLEEGAQGDFITIPAYYKANKQVYLWDNAWFTKAPQGSTGEDLGGSDDVNPWN